MIDAQAMIDNAPERTIAAMIEDAWSARLAGYKEAQAVRRKIETTEQLKKEMGDEQTNA